MKFLYIFLFSMVFAGCTSSTSEMKEAAIAEVQKRYEAGVAEEADRVIPNSDWLRKDFSAFVIKRTEYIAKDVVKLGENQAKVTVIVKSLMPPQRQMLAEIAGKVKPDMARNFNLTDALNMIGQRTKTPTASTEISSDAVFVVRSGEKWISVKP
jgi:hypothetical protein